MKDLIIKSAIGLNVDPDGNDDHVTISGYVSRKGLTDTVGHVFPNKDNLYDIDYFKSNGKLFLNHSALDVKEIVGTPIEVREDKKGLFARFKLAKPVDEKSAYGQVIQNVKDGIISSFSTGSHHDWVKDRYGRDTKVINKIKVFEVSLVSIPCVQGASVTGKSLNWREDMSQEDINTIIDNMETKNKERDDIVTKAVKRFDDMSETNAILTKSINKLEAELVKEREEKELIKKSFQELEISTKEYKEKEKERVLSYLKEAGRISSGGKFDLAKKECKFTFKNFNGDIINDVNNQDVQDGLEYVRQQFVAFIEDDKDSLISVQKDYQAKNLEHFEENYGFFKKHNEPHYDKLKGDYEAFLRNEQANFEKKSNISSSGATAGQIGITFPQMVDKELIAMYHDKLYVLNYFTQEPMIPNSREFLIPQIVNLGIAGVRMTETEAYRGLTNAGGFTSAGDATLEGTTVSVRDYGIGMGISYRAEYLSRTYANDNMQKLLETLVGNTLYAIEFDAINYGVNLPVTDALTTSNANAATSTNGLAYNSNVAPIGFSGEPAPAGTVATTTYGADYSATNAGVVRDPFNEGHIAEMKSYLDYRAQPKSSVLLLSSTPVRNFSTIRARDLITSQQMMLGRAGSSTDFRDLYYLDTPIRRMPQDLMPEDLKRDTAGVLRYRRPAETLTSTANMSVAIYGDLSKVHCGMTPTRIVSSLENAFPSQQKSILVQKYFGMCVPYKYNASRNINRGSQEAGANGERTYNDQTDYNTGAVMTRMAIRVS